MLSVGACAPPGEALHATLAPAATPAPAGSIATASACGAGSWRPGTLEIHHLALGQADATLLVGPTGRSLLVDLGESGAAASRGGDGVHSGAERAGARIAAVLGCKRLDAVLITHFHLDHVGAVGQGGLWHLVARQGFAVGQTFHRDLDRFSGETGFVFLGWQRWLREAPAELAPRVIDEGRGGLDLGPGVEITVFARDGHGQLHTGALAGASPPNENDYSVGFVLRFGRLDYLLAGDLSGELSVGAASTSHDIESAAARGLPDVDVYRVNHHGSEHASNPTWLGQMDPEISIISVGRDNPYGHPGRGTLRRLAATSAIYATSSGASGMSGEVAVTVADDVVVRSSDGVHYTVAGDPYVATDPVREDRDHDGYFREVDPDDDDAARVPAPFGGCEAEVEACSPGAR